MNLKESFEECKILLLTELKTKEKVPFKVKRVTSFKIFRIGNRHVPFQYTKFLCKTGNLKDETNKVQKEKHFFVNQNTSLSMKCFKKKKEAINLLRWRSGLQKLVNHVFLVLGLGNEMLGQRERTRNDITRIINNSNYHIQDIPSQNNHVSLTATLFLF